ncbi:glycoside hydrolase family 43 protein [Plantactinospora sp. S1510]|uniref:Glycoside hydrolase family 43 protein n=1 Tax=Plantactinospora alkalitolerans TaxID=2789879 RepID=A0ABS0H5K5_9ACTN|nr:glycoside hydrolase family 43 protein [Plantactinospora alkalitolerans]MBF9133755.1 glycoside hydrolase family 43 protein [Plantactinospora alkalitolerans]
MSSTQPAHAYRNPVLPGFHPDPSVCRVGEDYYLVCSSFEYFPGVPIFHSRDLVNWRQIGNVLDRPGQLDLPADTDASRGIYAPTIRHHDGRFWMVTTNVSLGRHLIVTATDPAGPWSEPVYLDLPHVDPSLAWDDNGDCWMTVSGVESYRIDPETGTVLEGPVPMWSGTGGQYPEAPHLYRIGEWWYLLVSEGGTHTGHAVSIARARTPRGPFEPGPANPFLTHRGTNRPIQAAGHADLVQAVDGSWWMILLGIRARGQWPPYHVLGRETFVVPVRWVDGWPVVDPVEEVTVAPAGSAPAMAAAPGSGARRDDFDGVRLAPYWISPRSRPENSWSLTERSGWLTLRASGATLDRAGATVLGRRQQHHDCRASVRVDPGTGRAGLTLRVDEAHHYDLEVSGGTTRVVGRVGPFRQVFGEHRVAAGAVTLTVATRTHDVLPPTVTSSGQVSTPGAPLGVRPAGSDTVVFEVETDDGPVVLAELDGRYLSTEVAAGFTGRVIGMYVTEGSAAFDWFDYRPAAVPED